MFWSLLDDIRCQVLSRDSRFDVLNNDRCHFRTSVFGTPVGSLPQSNTMVTEGGYRDIAVGAIADKFAK